jgi:cytochrome c oxidase assembly protein subunit 15
MKQAGSQNTMLFKVVFMATLLAFVVVVLGAYTRLTDAGLGCPDWPGCYGKILAPSTPESLQAATAAYPGAMVEPQKAWTEMVHRYIASSLGLLILTIFALSLRARRHESSPLFLPMLLVALVAFQGALGMWTVTWKLLPQVVMGHLLGGLLIFSLLACLCVRLARARSEANTLLPVRYRKWIVLGTVLLFAQIALGGWVSANYASLACIGFPTCNGTWWPSLGVDSKVLIHWVHRLGAVVTFSYLVGLALILLRQPLAPLVTFLVKSILLLVILQFTLGIINVTALVPLANACAHTAVAALLLALLASLTDTVYHRRTLAW